MCEYAGPHLSTEGVFQMCCSLPRLHDRYNAFPVTEHRCILLIRLW